MIANMHPSDLGLLYEVLRDAAELVTEPCETTPKANVAANLLIQLIQRRVCHLERTYRPYGKLNEIALMEIALPRGSVLKISPPTAFEWPGT